MGLLVTVGFGVFMAALALWPRFLRADVRGRVASVGMGHSPDGVPMKAGDGIRQISIEGEITAKVIEASLRDEGLTVQLHSSSAGGFGGIASAYFLLYREENEPRVLQAMADLGR
jgi:hypothetical protein